MAMGAVRNDAQDERRQPDGEHAADARQGPVPLGGRREGAVLEAVDGRRVDEEAQHARADQVSETGGRQEPEGRPVSEGPRPAGLQVLPALLADPPLQPFPGSPVNGRGHEAGAPAAAPVTAGSP